MRYLGLDVHVSTTVWCLMNDCGEVVERGKVATTVPDLQMLVRRVSETEPVLVGQEMGKMAYLVHDAVTALGTRILSFNAHHLRMIASSRKKTDRRDAYWVAKAMQTGMTPTPVYIPTGEVRQLRALLSRREALSTERTRWLLRARSYLQAAGYPPGKARRSVTKLIGDLLESPDGVDLALAQSLELCERMHEAATTELAKIDATLSQLAKKIEVVQRLQTIPAVGEKVALVIYAWVGDATRFRSARELASYAGLVPSVRQSGKTERLGGITRMGSPQLRTILVQAGHVLLWRCRGEPGSPSAPLKAIALRVVTARARRKVAIVAAARHVLRIAYYVMRDGTSYDPERLPQPRMESIEPQALPAAS